jgi:hypothetical protein
MEFFTYNTMLVLKKLQIINWVWWHTSVIPALGRYRQEDQEFKASLGFSEKKKKERKKKTLSDWNIPFRMLNLH